MKWPRLKVDDQEFLVRSHWLGNRFQLEVNPVGQPRQLLLAALPLDFAEAGMWRLLPILRSAILTALQQGWRTREARLDLGELHELEDYAPWALSQQRVIAWLQGYLDGVASMLASRMANGAVTFELRPVEVHRQENGFRVEEEEAYRAPGDFSQDHWLRDLASHGGPWPATTQTREWLVAELSRWFRDESGADSSSWAVEEFLTRLEEHFFYSAEWTILHDPAMTWPAGSRYLNVVLCGMAGALFLHLDWED